MREVLDFYNQFDDPIEAFRENQRKLQVRVNQSLNSVLCFKPNFIAVQEQQELMERMNQEKQVLPATSVARGLFGRRF